MSVRPSVLSSILPYSSFLPFFISFFKFLFLRNWIEVKLQCKVNRAFSHDVTAAILVFQNNETATMLVYQENPLGVELLSHVNAFFCSNKLAWMLATWVKTLYTCKMFVLFFTMPRCQVEGCNRGFDSAPRLRRHMKIHNKGECDQIVWLLFYIVYMYLDHRNSRLDPLDARLDPQKFRESSLASPESRRKWLSTYLWAVL